MTRTLVAGKPAGKPPKTAGVRAFPLDSRLTPYLSPSSGRFAGPWAAEHLAAGEAYQGGGYVLCDELIYWVALAAVAHHSIE